MSQSVVDGLKRDVKLDAKTGAVLHDKKDT